LPLNWLCAVGLSLDWLTELSVLSQAIVNFNLSDLGVWLLRLRVDLLLHLVYLVSNSGVLGELAVIPTTSVGVDLPRRIAS